MVDLNNSKFDVKAAGEFLDAKVRMPTRQGSESPPPDRSVAWTIRKRLEVRQGWITTSVLASPMYTSPLNPKHV